MSAFLEQAFQSHVQWKLKLLAAINEGQKIDIAVAGVDDRCDLGKWIYSEGQQFKGLPEFQTLQREHKAFHSCVRGVLETIEAGRLEDAKANIATGAYKKASSATIDAILKLKALAVVK